MHQLSIISFADPNPDEAASMSETGRQAYALPGHHDVSSEMSLLPDESSSTTIDCSPDDITTSLSDALLPLFTNGILCDVRFRGGSGCVISAHRVVLAAWSEPFRVMFSKGWQESGSDSEILIADEDVAPLRVMLNFMYTSRIHLDMSLALPVLALANRFAVVALQVRVESFIKEELHVGSCCMFMMAADRFSCAELRASCFEFAVREFESVAASNSFKALPFSCVLDLVSCGRLFVRSEEVVYKAVTSWVQGDPSRRIEHAPALLSHISFPLLSSRFLFDTVEKDPLIGSLEVLPHLLLPAYRFHALAGAGITPPAVSQMVERGKEKIIFGDRAGRLCPLSSSMSNHHPLENVRTCDDKYWLPFNADRAEIMIDLENLYRITKIRLQNRHSVEFQIMFKKTDDSAWRELVPITRSGRHKVVTGISLTGGSISVEDTIGRYLLLRLLGRSHNTYHTSIYWIEVHGILAPDIAPPDT